MCISTSKFFPEDSFLTLSYFKMNDSVHRLIIIVIASLMSNIVVNEIPQRIEHFHKYNHTIIVKLYFSSGFVTNRKINFMKYRYDFVFYGYAIVC